LSDRNGATKGAIYSDGLYLQNNPHWHAEDSAWKAAHIAAVLRRNNLTPETVCEVGCGAGEVLIELARQLPPSVYYDGYEISPDAYTICAPKSSETVRFHLADLMEQEQHFDVALAVDVFEHVEDYFSFLRQLRTKATYKVFHIPLELSALMVARRQPLIHERRKVGHLHHFSKETALATLEDTGYRVIDYFYTSGRTELGNIGWKTQLLKIPRKALFSVSPDAAARLLGGYSLLVLAE
jgi:cyclopropane fatty-acyl-phospholipid synthase-like methyltransferase